MMQLSLAGGAVNLSFNEVLYSQIGKNVLEYTNMDPYNWKVLIVYRPTIISPFIIFKESYNIAYGNHSTESGWITGMTPNGTEENLINFNYYGNGHNVNGGAIIMLLA